MNSKQILFVIAMFLFTGLTINANAETGTITISGTSVFTYTADSGAGTTAAWNFSSFGVLNSTYSFLTGFQIVPSSVTYANESGFSDFTVIAGGTASGGGVGTGTFYYNKSGNYLAWIFNNVQITGSKINLSYSNPSVFNQITIGNAINQPTLTSAKPMFIYKVDGQLGAVLGTGGPTYTVNIGSYTQNNYSVDYRTLAGTVYYNATITKSTISTKVQTRDYNGQQQIEATFNTNTATFFYPYGQGLYLNISLSNGLYTNQLINSSGVPVPAPTPTPAPIASGSSGSIVFDAASYQTGSSGTIVTNLSTGLLDLLSTYRVDFYSNTQPLISQFSLDTSLTTQSFPVLFSLPGSYTALLVKSTPLIGDTILAQDSAQVTTGTSYIFINGSVPYHTQVQTNYSFGVSGIDALNFAIQTYYLNPSTNAYDFEHSFFGLSQNGTKNVYFEKIGTYILKLKNVPQNIVYAQTSTQTVFAAPQITITINNSALNITKVSYFYGDTIFGNYTIDSTNWTSGQLYMSIYNYNKALTTAILMGSGTGWTDVSIKQQGDLLVTLLNVPASPNFAETNFVSGSNALRLMVRYANGTDAIMAYQNFTLTDQTSTGYGLKLSKYQVSTNEKFFAYAIVPEQATLILINTGTNSTTGRLLARINVNQSPATIPVSIPSIGNYAIVLNNPSGETEIMQNVAVIAAPTPTPTPSQSTSQIGTSISSLLQSTTFWALILIIGIMFTISMQERKK